MIARALLAIMLAAAAAHAASDLDRLFARAAADPAAVVPLIIAGSDAAAGLSADEATALAERLWPFCRRAAFSPERLPGMERLGIRSDRIARGETATTVARRHRIGAGIIALLNPGPLRAGRELKVLDATAPLTLVVSRSRFRMFVWRGPVLLAVLPISVGRPGHETPLGETTVASRVRDPEWRDPDSGRIFAPRDPGNVLGGYWLGFDPLPNRAFRGIGIHGFTAESPESWLGTASSHGCLRMSQPDVAVIFELALPGTKVVIRE